MISGKVNIVIGGVFFIIGLFSGITIYRAFLCPDTGKAIVSQLKKDDKKLTQIKKEAKVKDVKTQKNVVYIERIVAGECFDVGIPDDAADRVLNSLNN